MKTTFSTTLFFALGAILASACSSSPDVGTRSTEEGLAAGVLIGVDSAHPLSPGEAQALKNQHGVAWSGVYIGGPCNGGSGWSRGAVQAIHDATGFQFMPIYVGQQARSVCGASDLTYARGVADGEEAARDMAAFGWSAHGGIPVALDLEGPTYDGNPGAAIAYTRGRVDAARGAGYLAYVYSGSYELDAIVSAGVHVDGGWVASWIRGGFDGSLNPYEAPGLRSFTSHDRAWQYAGDIPGGYDADVADLTLAPGPGQINTGTCTAQETSNAAKFGCFCVNHQANGGFCEGTGCSAQETANAAKFGCGCVDHQGNGIFCAGTGCTPRETEDAAKFGCACVDHKANGGFCPGSGCTPKETKDAASFGCGCVDHKANGGACPGTGCTVGETKACQAKKLGCSLHECT